MDMAQNVVDVWLYSILSCMPLPLLIYYYLLLLNDFVYPAYFLRNYSS